MKKKLEDRLYKRFPLIFRQRDLSCQETTMCWGICCEDGWYEIINLVCVMIDRVNKDWLKTTHIEAAQVKQKFGELRYYFEMRPNDKTKKIEEDEATPDQAYFYVEGVVGLAAEMSRRTCEVCGATEKVKLRGKQWVQTLCDKHWEEVLEGNKKRREESS